MGSLAESIEEGRSALQRGELDVAEEACDRVLVCYPKHFQAQELLAQVRLDQGRWDEAEDICLQVLSVDPVNLAARWTISAIAERQGHAEDAVWQLQLAFDSHPRHAELRDALARLSGHKPRLTVLGLANLYRGQGSLGRAVQEYERALAQESGRLDALAPLAELLCFVGRRAESVGVCGRILQEAPDCLAANLIAACFADTGAVRELGLENAHWQRVRELDPETIVVADLQKRIGVTGIEPSPVEIGRVVPDGGAGASVGSAAVEPTVAGEQATEVPTPVVAEDTRPREAAGQSSLQSAVEPTLEPDRERETSSAPQSGPATRELSPEGMFALAKEQRGAGSPGPAVGTLAALLERAPEMRERIVAELEQILQDDPEEQSARRLLGDSYARLGLFQQALSQYKAALRHD